MKHLALLFLASTLSAAVVTVRPDGVFVFDGKPAFPIGLSTAPDRGSTAPSGRNAYAELSRNRVVFNRCGITGKDKWGPETEAALDKLLDESARNGMLCAIYLPNLTVIAPGDTAKEAELRRVVRKYRSHPAVAFWKGADEPEWGKVPVEKLRRFYEIVHELDPNHPVWITQAPRGTAATLAPYNAVYDVGAIDIYPVSYPPGVHTNLANKGLSMTGDYAHLIGQVTAAAHKPFWMTLQICFSGVIKPGTTLRFPTFPEQRYMSYQSIIAGARGLLYFGGNLAPCWTEQDRALGWNWNYYNKVLRQVLDEFSPAGPLYPALIAPDSTLPVRVEGAADLEFRVRESGNQLFILAAKREGSTAKVTFRGLPADVSTGDLLYEAPRKVTAEAGSFTDWFGPNEVHAYRFLRSAPVANRAPLQPNAFNTLPLTAVKPEGWLLDQLRMQAAGLSGHLDEFWPDLGPNSGWLGGSGESWERGPYFLDGLVPLAYLTGDARLIAKVKKWMDWTLDHQRADGWLGPDNTRDQRHGQDWWPNFVMLKALAQFQEATGDARVIPAMQRYFAYQLQHMDTLPLKQWAIFRWHDEVLTILWLYNRTGDAALLDLARKVHAQGHDWEAQFADFRTTGKVARRDANLSTHGVNNAMALKAAPVWWLLTGDSRDREGAGRMLSALDRYHGQPTGIFAADEHLAGRDPSQGTELCAVVEAMFSLETDIAILGDPALADRLERIAYNALPGTMTPGLWAHQYDQQANQISCTLANRHWTTNGPQSNLFGLEPNFGCCTANMHQGWPKLAANLWMATPEGGLAAVAYAPSTVTTAAATITERTGYPFRDTIELTVDPARAAKFPLLLRVPAWATAATISVNGQAQTGIAAGRFYRIDREWHTGDRVEIRFPMQVRSSTWYNNSIAVERGPLVFSLKIGENWHKLKQIGPAADWEILPTTPWNFALVQPLDIQVQERPIEKQPFSPDAAPVELLAKARRIPEWSAVDDSAGPLPMSPVTSQEPEQAITLVPYGSTRLRITALPLLK